MSSRGKCVAGLVAMMLSAGWLAGQVPANPIPTRFTGVQVVKQDAGCVWQEKQTDSASSHADGPRVRRTLFGFLGTVEAAQTRVSSGLLQGGAYAWDATLNDAGAAASPSAGVWSVEIARIRACSNPQPVIELNYNTSFRGLARVEGASSHAKAEASIVASCLALGFNCPAHGSVEVASTASAIGSVPVYGIPVPILVSSSPGPDTNVFGNQDSKTRAGITSAKLDLSTSVKVSTRADAMIGFFKTVAEAYMGNHVVGFEFTGRCNSCGGRIDVIRT